MTASQDAELLDAFAAYERGVLGLAPGTVRNHRSYLQAYARWWRGHRGAGELPAATSGDVAAFLVGEADRGLSARTRRAELAALRRLYAWLVLIGTVSTSPVATVTGPRPGPVRNGVYTSAQTEAILAHTATLTDVRGRQRHALVSTLRCTGMRSRELRLLRTAALDLSTGQVPVVGKGDRVRTVLLPPALVGVLTHFLVDVRPQLPASPLLFVNAHPLVTTPLSGLGQEALSREVELAGLGAGVPGRHHPHKWRHTYATELVRAGVDIHVVQRLLGHRSIASTVGYTHLVVDDLRDAVADVWG